MPDYNILLPSKPRIVLEKDFSGVYEIDNLYPGYGQTLGNSLRRIILSSLPGAAITAVRITGVSHEFSTIAGVKEDVITILLNLKKVRFKVATDEPQTLTLKVKGASLVTAADIKTVGQVEILNPDVAIATVTDKNTTLEMELTVENGLGYVAKEALHKNRVDIGTITLDALFSPVRRANYEVENMRVGDRTNFNRLKLFIETDGSISPREVLEKSIEIMITQLKAIIGFKEEESVSETVQKPKPAEIEDDRKDSNTEFLKTRIESLGLSSRTENALSNANIRTVGGLVRKREEDILEIEGLGSKGLTEIKKILTAYGVTLRD